MVLKELISLQFLLLEGCSIFNSWDGVVVLKELIFVQFLLLECVVVLKELIFNSFYCGRVWWS